MPTLWVFERSVSATAPITKKTTWPRSWGSRDVVRWSRPHNLFFGGVQAVSRSADGSFAAAGDPRRGGFGTVVR